MLLLEIQKYIDLMPMYFLLSEVQEMEQTLPHGCRIHFDDANKLYQFTLTISKSASLSAKSHDAATSVSIFTVYRRSLLEGNVFSRVCLSFCPQLAVGRGVRPMYSPPPHPPSHPAPSCIWPCHPLCLEPCPLLVYLLFCRSR